MSFVHLHVHTQFSLLDSALRVSDLVARVKECRMPAVAMTDHANLFGAVEFFSAVKESRVKPIIGCELYLAPGSRFDREALSHTQRFQWNRLVLLCQDEEGYGNLCRLVSAAHLEGYFHRPRIDRELLTQYGRGLIALTDGAFGEFGSLLSSGKKEEALAALQWYFDLFGDRLYLELHDHGLPEQKRLNLEMLEIGKTFGIPAVATNDCHYLRREDSRAATVLRCIRDGIRISDLMRSKEAQSDTREAYVKSPEEMRTQFSYSPEAVENSLGIAERCHFSFQFNTYHMPKFAVGEGETLEGRLRKLTEEGWKIRREELTARLRREKRVDAAATLLPSDLEQHYRERLERELSTIQSMGFSGYFLIVADFIGFAKKKGIPVGPGRGSSAGSLVAFCLFITDIDPIEHQLIFERFLNPERVSMPDMDIDFCMDRRGEVIEYVASKYGSDNVAQIITFGKLQAKAAIKDVGRVYEMSFAEVDKITKLIPPVLNIAIQEALEQEPKLKKLYQEDHQVQQVIDTALLLEGLFRHASIHAAGVVISNKPMYEYLPLFRGKEGEMVTQFDMKSVEKIGLIKFDFLGLRTLTLIEKAVEMIRRRRDSSFDMNHISFDDKGVFDLLSSGDTGGVFQLESSGMRDLVSRLKPNCFEDITAVNALFRPGPLGSGMVDDFINRKHARIEITYLHPLLEEILKSTYGVILYQEQVMKIANVLANYSLGEADLLRRAMGKKKKEEMEKQKERFVSGACLSGKATREEAEHIFDLMAKFAEYGFPRSHSAAYALVAYRTAYLKVHYPVEFFAALLTTEMSDTEKMTRYIYDARARGIEILPPHINESEFAFTPAHDKAIRVGLGAIKNVGTAAIDEILAKRAEKGAFQSLREFCEAMDLRRVNKKVIEYLIKGGAIDLLKEERGASRAQLMSTLPQVMESAQTTQRDAALGQVSLFEALSGEERTPENREEVAWSRKQELKYERETLGFYVSGHPLNQHLNKVRKFSNAHTESIRELPHKSVVTFAGVVVDLSEKVTKSGERMAFALIEDLRGTIPTIIFAAVYRQVEKLLNSDEPLLLTGTVEQAEEGSRVFVNTVEPLADLWSREARGVKIWIDELTITPQHIEKMRELCNQYQGDCPGTIHFKYRVVGEEKMVQAEALLSLPMSVRLEPKDLFIAEIEQILGAGAVECF